MKKRIFSRLMAMVMAVALLSTTALAYVEINQDYIDELNKDVVTSKSEHKYVYIPQGEDGDNEYKLVEDVKTDYSLHLREDATLDLNGFTIDHQGKEGSVIEAGEYGISSEIVIFTIKDSSDAGTGTITGGNATFEKDYGGGVKLSGSGSTLILESGNITGNKAYRGAGVGCTGGERFIMHGGSITNNEAYFYTGVDFACGGTVEITGGVITGNISTCTDGSYNMCDGVVGGHVSISGDAAVCGNGADGKGINVYLTNGVDQQTEPYYHHYLPATCTEPSKCKGCGEVVPGSTPLGHQHTELRNAKDPNCEGAGYTGDTWCTDCNTIIEKGTDIAPNGHTPGAPVRENEVAASAGITGSYDEVVYCTVCNSEISRTTVTITALPMPIDFGDGFTGGADAGTTIDDEATPLAGIVTEAQLLDALYEHEGSPAVETVEKYAAHEYAPAISWALANAVEVDDEDFDPDEVVTVALLREVLESYVEYKGIDFTVTVDGEDEELVLDLSERLTVFFAQLEK